MGLSCYVHSVGKAAVGIAALDRVDSRERHGITVSRQAGNGQGAVLPLRHAFGQIDPSYGLAIGHRIIDKNIQQIQSAAVRHSNGVGKFIAYRNTSVCIVLAIDLRQDLFHRQICLSLAVDQYKGRKAAGTELDTSLRNLRLDHFRFSILNVGNRFASFELPIQVLKIYHIERAVFVRVRWHRPGNGDRSILTIFALGCDIDIAVIGIH